MNAVMMVAGLAMLLVGGEGLVRGAMAFATRMRLPMAVVGAVVLGFSTSMPEMLTSLSAALAGAPGIAIGNVLGSNIANIVLILGVAAVIAAIPTDTAETEDRVWLVVATVLGIGVIVIGADIGRIEGMILLGALAVYLWRALGRDAAMEPVPEVVQMGAGMIALYLLVGLGILVSGAWLLVEGATGMARAFGVSETLIGLTIVAVGTSLPELATSVIAARRGEVGLALGNVLGSNVFNILAILGLTAVVVPIPVPADLSMLDLGLVAGTALLLIGALTLGRIGRGMGLLFLAIYAAYIGWLVLNAA